MGSSCCKNVRVTGIPQQEPTNVNNLEEQIKKSILPIPLPLPKETESETSDSQSITTHFPQPHNSINSNQRDQTPIPFRLQDVSSVNDRTNNLKSSTVSQLPPIRKHKYNPKNGTQQLVSPRKPLSKIIDTEETNQRNPVVHLPPLELPSDLRNNQKDLLESVSDENRSIHDYNMDDDWHLLTTPDKADFDGEDRFFTSTPIPASPEQSDSDEEHVQTLNHLLRPMSNNLASDEEYTSAPLTVLEILRLREQANLAENIDPIPIPNLQLSSQQLYSISNPTNFPMVKILDSDREDLSENSFDEPTIYLTNTSAIVTERINTVGKLIVVHPEAFDEAFNVKRQHTIDNSSYRLVIEAWRPNTIEQLIEQIKNFTKNKPLIDRLWIVFYWIARNIEYDTVPYVGKKLVDKSAEAVFRTRKAVSDGYANLFKYLCRDLDLICVTVMQKSIFSIHAINHLYQLIIPGMPAGHLDDNQVFKRELNSYYFLSPPNEMIYHHFPADEQWQLLKQPIKMVQYMQMPKLWPKFFQLDLQLISPCDTIHVDLIPRQSYASVLIQAPRHVSLIASFMLNEKEIDGGHRIAFDAQKRLHRCYFAPAFTGVHTIRFFAKNDSVGNSVYCNVAEFELDIRQMPPKPISFPKTWKSFYELNLEIIWPCNTHLIKMNHGDTHTEILIRAPNDVELASRLAVDNNVKVFGGYCTYFDRRKGLWRCLFAPHRDDLFDAYIMAKRRLDPGSFVIVARFKIKAKRVPMPPLSYPKTWQLFHDLDLQIEVPRNSATVLWPEYGSYTQVCIRTPDDVRLMCCIEYNGVRVENGALTQFNNERQYWQLYFSPERTGQHKLLVFAHCSTPDGSISGIAVEFHLDVTQLRHSIKFPVIYTTFLAKKCRIYEPLCGILKKDAVVGIHCEVPDARQVDLTIDSKWVKTEGYRNSILKRQITVGSREVIIYAKYDENTIYSELIKYIVQ